MPLSERDSAPLGEDRKLASENIVRPHIKYLYATVRQNSALYKETLEALTVPVYSMKFNTIQTPPLSVNTTTFLNSGSGIRQATLDDVNGILDLIRPMELRGNLVRREREDIERDIDAMHVLLQENAVVGCVALHPYATEGTGELACLTVSPNVKGSGQGRALLSSVEERALGLGLNRIFILTKTTEAWFSANGFQHIRVEDLPIERQARYNPQRRSLVMEKILQGPRMS